MLWTWICHILLGGPWQYDVDAKHKSRQNIYIFLQKGKKIVTNPSEEQIEASKLVGDISYQCAIVVNF